MTLKQNDYVTPVMISPMTLRKQEREQQGTEPERHSSQLSDEESVSLTLQNAIAL